MLIIFSYLIEELGFFPRPSSKENRLVTSKYLTVFMGRYGIMRLDRLWQNVQAQQNHMHCNSTYSKIAVNSALNVVFRIPPILQEAL